MKDIISVVTGELQTEFDGAVMKAVRNCGIHVNKEELIKALELAESLVRCKDCKHNPKYTKDFQYGKCVYTCDDDWYACEPMDDFFCAYGERKDNE